MCQNLALLMRTDQPDNSRPSGISRRRFLGGAAAVAAPAAIGVGGLLAAESRSERAAAETLAQGGASGHGAHTAGHSEFPHATFAKDRRVDHARNGFHPTEILRDFDYGTTHRLPSGRVVREWELVAQDREIEVAPGVSY